MYMFINIIPKEVLDRVFLLSIGLGKNCTPGSGLLIENNENEQFIITARHLFNKVNYPKKCMSLLFYINREFDFKDHIVYYHKNKHIDVAVIYLIDRIDISGKFSIQLDSNSLAYNCNTYCVGFPMARAKEYLLYDENNHLLPYIEKTNFLYKTSDNELFFSGIINRGFSGGPICYIDSESNICRIVGVISRLDSNNIDILKQVADNVLANKIIVTKDDTIKILAYDIKYGLEIINGIIGKV